MNPWHIFFWLIACLLCYFAGRAVGIARGRDRRWR